MSLNLNDVSEVKEASTIEQANTLLDEGWTLLSTRISEDIRFTPAPVGGSIPRHETQFIYLLGREKPLVPVDMSHLLTKEEKEWAK